MNNPLSANTTLSHYRIVSKIGAGGMGEVYRATDTRLKRDVAIKVLPEAFVTDAERLARFEREAQVLASLNHPNIAAIYGLEESGGCVALVLELAEGLTLDDRLRRGPLPLAEALALARQIAEALEYAHERGVVHRDLKPSNIKVAPDGMVKVLDFGLAKAFAEQTSETDLSEAPTLKITSTQAGMILGTPAYMSPEQAQGAVVDKRSDIWSFGVVLYEMLSGKRLFDGASSADTLAAVLRDEIAWSALPAGTPAAVSGLVRRCLERDRKRRLRDIGEARILIEDQLANPAVASIKADSDAAHELASVTADGSRASAGAPHRSPILPRWLWLCAALAIGSAVTLVLWITRPASAPRPVGQFSIETPSVERAADLAVALSPDGRNLAYVGGGKETRRIFIRSIDHIETREIPGTNGAQLPFFSVDGEWVGFFADNMLKKVALAGGAPTDICSAPGVPLGGAWGSDGAVVFAARGSGLQRVSATGGKPVALTTVNADLGESHEAPAFLPDGTHVLFSRYQRDHGRQIAVVDLSTGQSRNLLPGGAARYVSTGHLVYASTNSLYAAPFDATRLSVGGNAVLVVDDVQGDNGAGSFAVGGDGTLVYVPAVRRDGYLSWVDREGRTSDIGSDPARYRYPRVSPDGKRIAVSISTPTGLDVWVIDAERGARTRVTTVGENAYPLWTPDGKHIVFSLDPSLTDNAALPARARVVDVDGGATALYTAPADGSGPPELLLKSAYPPYPLSFAPDGAHLAFRILSPETRNDIEVLSLADHQVSHLQATPYDELSPAFAPNGRWIAYVSDESGRDEVYVRPYPGQGAKVTVSTGGGRAPVWSRDGSELFYRQGNAVIAVPVTFQPTFAARRAKRLFEGSYELPSTGGNPYYDVAPDGRFVMIRSVDPAAGRQLRVVLNWFEELSRISASGKH